MGEDRLLNTFKRKNKCLNITFKRSVVCILHFSPNFFHGKKNSIKVNSSNTKMVQEFITPFSLPYYTPHEAFLAHFLAYL